MRNKLCNLFVILFALAYSCWWASGGSWRFTNQKSETRLLEMQVEAFSAGQLNLLVDPDPRLLELSNPLDPEANRGVRMLDATLYNRKYFTYFAPAPMAVYMWPYYAATGRHIPSSAFAAFLGTIIFTFQGLAVLRIGRTWFAEVSQVRLTIVALMGPPCALLAPLIVSHENFDIPVLAAIGFSLGSFYFLARAYGDPGRSSMNWAIASIFAGLACASRSLFIPAQALMLATALILSPGSTRRLSKIVPVFGPYLVILLMLGAYNWARFDNPLDFGNARTLVEIDWSKTRPFSVSYMPLNFYLYCFSIPRLTDSFPFFLQSAALPSIIPSGYLSGYVDRVAGIAVLYPFLLSPLLAVFTWRNWSNPAKGLFLAGMIGAVAIFLVIISFVGSSIRYQSEIVALVVPLAAVTVISLINDPRAIFRRVAVCVVTCALLVTVTANGLVAWVGERGLGARNSSGLSPLVHASDTVVQSLKNVLGICPQVPVLEVTFPRNMNGKSEPIWVEGRPGEANFLYIYYSSPSTIQFGFEVMGRGGPLSSQVAVDYSAPHAIKIVCGRFLPPAGHSFHASLGVNPELPPQDMLQVILDGAPVFNARLKFHDGRKEYYFGESPYEAAFGSRFSGDLKVRWEDFVSDDYARWVKNVSDRH